MGAFIFVGGRKWREAGQSLPVFERHFRAVGFTPGFRVETERFGFLYFPKIGSYTGNFVDLGGGDFAASAGTLIYDGRVGRSALEHLLKERGTGRLDEALRACSGHFALVTCLGGEVVVRRDVNSSFEVFSDPDRDVVSSSFLAVARSLPRRGVAADEAVEYVLNGVTFGAGTPIREVCRLDAGETLHLLPGRTVRAPLQLPPEMTGSVEEAAEEVLSALTRHVRDLVRVFGDNMTQALSGGYDTRLLLALFRRVGVTPGLFVYGGRNSPDVRVAKAIASGEGLALEHVDKSLPPLRGVDEMRATVERNFLVCDGYAHVGLFEHSTEYEARLHRHRQGALNVNGGGGEVLRNFFGLPDERVSTDRLTSAFFSQFDPAFFRRPELVRQYRETLARKMLGTLGSSDRELSRRQVEALYPHFRCRSWFGRDIGINSQYGYSVLPFYDGPVTEAALRVPVRYKHFGDFEGRLIRMADPKLAGYPSQYGHDFAANAPPRHRAAAWLGYRRPASLRRRMYTIKGKLRGARLAPDLRTDWIERIAGQGFPYMSRYFDVDRIWSTEQFLRVASLEYLFQELSAAA